MRSYLPSAQRKSQVVEAVLALAARREPGAITTAAIATELGLTQGALFKHFARKDEIWLAAVEWAEQALFARLDEAAQAAASPLEALEAMFLAHADFVVAHPGVPRIVFAELQRAGPTATRAAARGLMERYAARVAATLAAAVAAGQAGRDLDARAAATLFVGALQGLVVQSMIAGEPGRLRARAREVFAVYRRAVAAREVV